MSLKLKSFLISFGIILFFAILSSIAFYELVTIRFQEIENQRVERNIKRLDAIYNDKLNQIDTKLADWTIWDDTYKFINDNNQAYIDSNISVEAFSTIQIDEVLFINNNKKLVASYSNPDKEIKNNPFSKAFFEYPSFDQTLLQIDPATNSRKGLVKTEGGLLMFVSREVVKSDGSGTPAGHVVFGRYFDEEVVNSMRDLTQFDADMRFLEDPDLPSDFVTAKEKFNITNTPQIKPLSKDIISGYMLLSDVYNSPVAIMRTDIVRDITNQGAATRNQITLIIILIGALGSLVNFFILNNLVFKKLLQMASDVESLGKTDTPTKRLIISSKPDEIDKVRQKINSMIDLIQTNKEKLTQKEQFIDVVMDNLPIGIAINQISNGKAIYMNKAFENIYGWSRDTIVDVDSFFEKVYPDSSYRSKLKKKVQEDIKSGNPERMIWQNLKITTSKGSNRIVDARNIPLIDQNLMVSTVVDVTDTQTQVEARLRYTKDLEKLNELMVNRELKMISLKKQLKKLQK